MEHTLVLIEKAHGGDKEARETLVEENMGLVYTIVRRFAGGDMRWRIWCRLEASG